MSAGKQVASAARTAAQAPAKKTTAIRQVDELRDLSSQVSLMHPPVHVIPPAHDLGKIGVEGGPPLPIQTKLTINSPGDSYEQEADQVAGKVMRMPEPAVQRTCACGGTCPDCKKAHEGAAPGGAKHDEHIQTKRSGTAMPGKTTAPDIVHEVLRSPGQPLDSVARSFMEPRFGHDFGKVRVHYDGKASSSAKAVQARAYTVGHNIVFGEGQYSMGSDAGKSLLAHELTHVIQQQNGLLMRDATADTKPFDVDTISKDIRDLKDTAIPIGASNVNMALLYFKYNRHASGELTKAADYPTKMDPAVDKTKPIGKIPPPDNPAPLSNVPIEAHFFPSIWPGKGTALVMGGFHGDEHPGWQITDTLVQELSSFGGNYGLGFNTIVIPRVNAGAIQDELNGVRLWRNRCNRQMVDLNRNFPTGDTARDTDCVNTTKAPVQPEVKAVMDVIKKFMPDRILSTHAISGLKSGGIFADPNNDPEAIKLARGMATTVVHPNKDIPHNRLGAGEKDFNPVYPLDSPGKVSGGTSLGAWAPTNANPGDGTKANPGKTTPTITMETPGFKPLADGKGTDPRTIQGYLRPVRAFLGDPATIDRAADNDIVTDIMDFEKKNRVALLTGRLDQKNDIFQRIKTRIDTAVAELNAMGPPEKISIVSNFRAFAGGGGGGTTGIDFEKFFLSGSRRGGWDSLPDKYFKGGDRSKGVDRAKWLATPSKERLDVILQFSALPGTSRHHWGTDVDFNSVTSKDWEQGGAHFDLGQWLQANAAKAGFIQAYSPGRKGGYNDEPWHFSYAPIAISLREMYEEDVDIQKDVIDPLIDEFTKRAKGISETVPSDFGDALKAIDIKSFVNDINPKLKPK
jgi:hypothetical protein